MSLQRGHGSPPEVSTHNHYRIVHKAFLDIVSKACWLVASPVDTEGDCSDALACITRVVSWTQCSTERSWSALISLMKANNLTTAAIEIEKCLKMIVSKYPSSPYSHICSSPI